jgi:hypothetical protein
VSRLSANTRAEADRPEGVALCAIASKVERGIIEDGDEIGEAVHHLLTFAELVVVVEVSDINHALEVIGFSEFAYDLVDLVANLFITFQRHHVGKSATDGHVKKRILLASVFIGHVFDEEEDEHIVLILRGVHATAKFVAAFPEGAIEFRFFDGHLLNELSFYHPFATNW